MTPSQQLDKWRKAKIDNELVDSLNEGLRVFGESVKLNETISCF